jgi:prepilin-type N-terminal cleavage/methylation domain-containing protein
MRLSEGFTLVELMVVVALVGILAAVAVPQYLNFKDKAANSEAYVGLSGLYTSETAFSAENGSFTGCINQIGFSTNSTHKFTIGFGDAQVSLPQCGLGSLGLAQPCNMYDFTDGRQCTIGDGSTRYTTAYAKTPNFSYWYITNGVSMNPLDMTKITTTTFFAQALRPNFDNSQVFCVSVDQNKVFSYQAYKSNF